MESKEEIVRKWIGFYKEGGGEHPTTSHELVMKMATRFKDNNISSILDVGCGRGRVAKELMIQKFDVECTEIVPEIVTKLSKTGVTVYPYDSDQLGLIDRSFDLVMLIDALEHFRDPLKAIDNVCGLTKRFILACDRGEKFIDTLIDKFEGKLYARITRCGSSCCMISK
jgi:2-polyprenyl-3-methyl-5-hydroxy-6-metoxy-1,4-benzoquinol methylase